MGFYLQAADIVDCFTAEQIQARIDSLFISIENAEQSVSDKFEDGQASQQVRRQKLDDLNSQLAVWVKAKNLMNGTESSTAELISGNFNPVIPRF